MTLLTDPTRCPSCHSKTVSFDTHKCRTCETPLFQQNSGFMRFQAETLIRAFWVFFPNKGTFHGWVHSDHLDNPKPNT